MKLTNAIKKLTTAGFEVKTTDRNLEAKKGNKIVGCLVARDGEAKRFYTKNVDQNSDVCSDYFVETWHDNISQAIKFTALSFE